MIPESRRRRRPSGAADSVLELAQQREDAIAASAAKEIDLLGRDEPLPKDIYEATERRRSGALGPPRTRRTRQRLLDVSTQLLVQILPCPPELLDERIVGPGINVVGREHTRLTPAAFTSVFNHSKSSRASGVSGSAYTACFRGIAPIWWRRRQVATLRLEG